MVNVSARTRIAVSTAVAALAAAAGLALPAAPATAGPVAGPVGGAARQYDLHDCPNDRMCAWEHAYHQGKFIYMAVGCHDFGACFASDFSNRATSLYNDTGVTWCFYTGTGYTGHRYAVSPGAQIANVGLSWNDRFRSAHVWDGWHTC
ncbi:MAG TPA: peptidase inhibitor family I36 protein [Pilimelia sp.]|nr:peptidase inhibitor family I36 protein [Pilimelia sp.]